MQILQLYCPHSHPVVVCTGVRLGALLALGLRPSPPITYVGRVGFLAGLFLTRCGIGRSIWLYPASLVGLWSRPIGSALANKQTALHISTFMGEFGLASAWGVDPMSCPRGRAGGWEANSAGTGIAGGA